MNSETLTLAITSGEPAGIGPDISLQAVLALREEAAALDWRFVLIGDANLFETRSTQLGLDPSWRTLVKIEPVPLAVPAVTGKLDARNGKAVLAMLDRAIKGTRLNEYDAVITAPVQKSTINEAGIAFTGHTEYFAEQTGTPLVVMMLIGGGMRVALVTTHLPLKDVPAAITSSQLSATLNVLRGELQRSFDIAEPRILVTGLNPHAGEAGYLGREEVDVIAPVIQTMQGMGRKISGPYPADTLFQPKYLQEADCVLAMYHDQGLTVLKYASFGEGVNITLGLPMVRTSVDHGTALDLAGSGKADCGSMIEAIRTAALMARNRKKY